MHSHIGHARVYVAFDTLLRTLHRHGYDVTCVRSLPLQCAVFAGRLADAHTHAGSYVRNFTDVDDKIIRRAAEARPACAAPWLPAHD